MKNSLSGVIVKIGATIKEVLNCIDKNAQGVCFVVDDGMVLHGIITDGDARRALLNGHKLEDVADEIMVRDFVWLPITSSTEQIQKTFSELIRLIPLLDENKVLVDYASNKRYGRIPILEPVFMGNELSYVTDCIKTGWVSSIGEYVTKFEAAFAEFCGSDYALSVANGTVALQLALSALDIGEGDEVIVPDFTFAASINAIINVGATPVIVDVEMETWTICIAALKEAITEKTKAIMPVHIYGHPCRMDEIKAISQQLQLLVIEDCAEAIGTKYKGQQVGTDSDCAAFSFFGNKTITTGEGGMVLFKDKEVYEKAKTLRAHGMSTTKRYWHDVVGFNYRMTNIQAAIGLAQMENIAHYIASKKTIASSYRKGLASIENITLPPEKEWAENGFWLYTILLDESLSAKRDELMEKLSKKGVETRPAFYPLHEMPPYSEYGKGKAFPNSKNISYRGISLPSSVNLLDEEIQNVIETLKVNYTTYSNSN